MVFESLEQRMAQNYLRMLPDFIPDSTAPVSMAEQEQFYHMIRNLYQLAFDEPLLFVTSLHEDDAYPTRYKKAYNKPELIVNMRKFTKSVDAILEILYQAGRGESVKISKRQAAILSRLGIQNIHGLPAALKWMALRDGGNLTAFSLCFFDLLSSAISDIYARLLGENAFKTLEHELLLRGYKRFNVYNVTASDCKLSLTIANPKWSHDPPRGYEYKVKHTGVSARFDDYALEPAIIGLCIPGGMKPYLQSFDAMDEDLKTFVVEQTKKCDACGYCTQTDKTGTRRRAFVPTEYRGKTYNLCTFFPGYTYCWTSLDDALVAKLLKFLAFMDEFMPAADTFGTR